MAFVKMNKDEIKKLIDDSKFISVHFEENWRYPKTGDDQKTCPMLDVMFAVENKAGYIIHIPKLKSNGKNIGPMTKPDIKEQEKKEEQPDEMKPAHDIKKSKKKESKK